MSMDESKPNLTQLGLPSTFKNEIKHYGKYYNLCSMDNIQTVNISQSQPYELHTFNIFIPINIKIITNYYELGSNQP